MQGIQRFLNVEGCAAKELKRRRKKEGGSQCGLRGSPGYEVCWNGSRVVALGEPRTGHGALHAINTTSKPDETEARTKLEKMKQLLPETEIRDA